MGASRKLQGEIDRVLKKVQEGVEVFDSIWNKVYDTDNANQKEKFEADLKKEIKKLQRYRDQIKTWIQSSEIKDKKVSASYEQALMDSRKLIEREMERFKICEKETKTKAFSKEGLGQQPKTDPKEKAKSETRDWLNNVVGELELQIDNFEAEIESLSVKKGRARPPRLTHLETSIVRHRAHIMKLELILRLLDNDELSPEQVNDIKDFLEDYVERNQEDFEDFEEVDEFYSSLPLDKVESLEDLVTTGPPGHPKVSAAVSTAKVAAVSQVSGNNNQQGQSDVLIEEQPVGEDIAAVPPSALDNADPESVPRTPSLKNISAMSSPSISSAAANPVATSPPPSPFSQIIVTPAAHNTSPLVLPPTPAPPALMKAVNETAPAATQKEDDSPAGAVVSTPKLLHGKSALLSPSPGTAAVPLSNPLPRPTTPETSKRNPVSVPDATGSTTVHPPPPPPPILSPLTGRMTTMHQTTGNNKSDPVFVGNDAPPPSPSVLSSAAAAVSSTRSFSPSLVQWRAAGAASFQSQNEVPQFRARTEIAPDQREKFLQRLQQVQQQQQLFTQQQQKTLPPPPPMQQQVLHAQAASYIPQSDVTASDSHPNGVETAKDGAHPVSMDAMMMMMAKSGLPGMAPDVDPLRDGDSLLPVARRGAPDVTDSVNAAAAGDDRRMSNLQMLESAFYKLPQAKDSERVRTYVPRHPAAAGSIPPSYPQTQAPIVNHPAFWERLGLDPVATDTLFFAFYYQQNSYQQYLAAKELKKQSWRYHRKYNTWFQRHEEPKVATDEYEQGTYVYFDFHVPPDDPQHGWCQRIKTDFAFEYNYLEDELPV